MHAVSSWDWIADYWYFADSIVNNASSVSGLNFFWFVIFYSFECVYKIILFAVSWWFFNFVDVRIKAITCAMYKSNWQIHFVIQVSIISKFVFPFISKFDKTIRCHRIHILNLFMWLILINNEIQKY